MPTTRTERLIHVVQGEFYVNDESDVVLTTILGSCVAACMRDPLARVGGMHHFLLPGGGAGRGSDAMHYGVHAMELLVNPLLRDGARRDRLEAKLFGGAVIRGGLTGIGAQNADFAERFLQRERIALLGGSLRGERGRRVQFWPLSGRARQMTLERGEAAVFASERHLEAVPSTSGSVELL